ncbi:NAD(P)/FAD-dependent oxidoreductase (plasmid) [Cupriavidus necator H16]|uniref:NAD(P)/FAD-dependent oxidoreductase n=1 Tax=Cupriavidus necator (strain ATCC 17699 / DSM 428 / KCTC 22496 / NCIMB 10442 / H16 / Stanier 337) TaxID=381666 RepID=Q7WWS8_CUPNH|nr:NAD(P)/FAD-dependent oxidoreductase [Cupriavidus necator]AAP86163.1 putative NADH dehydrogenase [Cupriavidus necator H16]QCC05626.1 NAD(P)/FAD-dependent oxidoreductase [Cupriavidus necator H16]QQB81448.1 NAD(P)/FAD-dependent oxidoreductase [Cupriavidus necator]
MKVISSPHELLHQFRGRRDSVPADSQHQIVIVGGGAGGLELATALGNKLGKRGLAAVTLIDKTRSHIWKPKLHEIAAGSMDMNVHEVEFLAQSHWHHFTYRVGEMIGLDRERQEVEVAAFIDDEGHQVTPQRRFRYDTLVIAVGSQSNDFGTPGVSENALKLESPADARRFNQRLVNACIRAHAQPAPLEPHQLQVAIIGAGATDVELAAELHRTTRALVAYGLDRIDPEKDIRLNLIEAADRVLPALPARLSAATEVLLRKLGVELHTSSRVAEVLPQGVQLADGRIIAAELVVWAAGVKAPEHLKELAGLETNRINQLVVRQTLQTTLDDNIFALGDCAACPWPEKNSIVPPRAQAAHQQASHIVGQVLRRLRGKPLRQYRYRDFGSLVSLGEYSTVGNMMGGLSGGNLMIEGSFARLMYLSLYKMHELALHGFPKVALDTLARLITRRTEPHVKLH